MPARVKDHLRLGPVAMPPDRSRCRPALEALEARRIPSLVAPIDTIGTAQGVVAAPGQVARVQLPVAPGYLTPRKHATVLRLTAQPGPGGALRPAIVPALGPGGARLPFHPGAAHNPVYPGVVTAYAKLDRPGPLGVGVTGRQRTTGPFVSTVALPGDVNGDGKVNLQDLKAFVPAYLTRKPDAFYNPAADANLNGFVGQGDAKALLRNLPPPTPKVPLKIDLHLAPGDQVPGHHSATSGGVTAKETVTILGRTTPGAIVFADSGLGDYTFTGPAIAPDARGNFSLRVTNKEGLNNFNFLAIDPYGQQAIRSFPIFWTRFASGQVS